MTERIEQYMRLGIVHFMAFPETVEDESRLVPTLETIARDPSFRAVELKLIQDKSLLAPVRELLQCAMLDPALAAQPALLGGRLDPGSAEPEMRSRLLDIMKTHVDQALELGAGSVAMVSGPDSGSRRARADALERTADLVAEVCHYSSLHDGPEILLEVFDREIDKKALIGPAETALRLGELVYARGSDNFGLLADLSHLPLLGETPAEALEPVQDYLKAAHLGNAVLKPGHPLYGDKHPGFGTPEGVNKVDQTRDFIHVLKNIGFLRRKDPPVVSYEIRPQQGERIEVMIAAAHRVLRRAWAKA